MGALKSHFQAYFELGIYGQIHSVHIAEDKIIPKAVDLVYVTFIIDVVPIVSSH